MNLKSIFNKLLKLYAPHLSIIETANLYAIWEEQQLKKLLSHFNVDCVFDIGANCGQYATMLREKADYTGTILSFEPIPNAAQEIRKLSKNDPDWHVFEQAVSCTDGELTFNIMEKSQFSSLSTPRHDETKLFTDMNKVKETVTVKSECLENIYNRLSKYLKFKRPFLKMDTQGFDLDVLKSGQSILQNYIGLQSELSIKKIYEESVDFRDAISTYEKYGFSLSAFVPNNAGHFPELIEIDCIMIRNELIPGFKA
jgi:FkbM family methyltransferase|tara:strand:- start:914 stop:1678 length:765 start_codon:yes stop_codon:yes gene_type:complete